LQQSVDARMNETLRTFRASHMPQRAGCGESAAPEERLRRSLRGRHIQLISIGGTIGVGLFLGAAKAIQSAGPGLLLNYAIAGAAVFFIMRALGELLSYRPVAGAFGVFADEFISPFAGFVTGWTYWFTWVVVGMAELTAIGMYVRYWFPDVPQWASALAALGLLYGSNLLAVRIFGELEFWFAVVKVLTIVALIALGVIILVFGVGELGPTASVENLWTHGGMFPFGVVGVLVTVQIVAFAYAGVEIVAMTAAEAENPGTTLPRAANGIIVRILIFYIGALVVIMALVPWNQLSATVSPFVVVFSKLGIPGAAHVINLVVITAAASSCNSGLYSTARVLYSESCRGHAPQGLARLSSRRVPANAVHLSAAAMLVGVALNAIVPQRVFTWVTSVSLVGTLWTWFVIVLVHMRYRQAVQAGRVAQASFRMPGAPVTNWLVMVFILVVTAMLSLDADTRVALYVAPVWLGVVTLGYLRIGRATRQQMSTHGGHRQWPSSERRHPTREIPKSADRL
jgi:amino acid transporter, AAT family